MEGLPEAVKILFVQEVCGKMQGHWQWHDGRAAPCLHLCWLQPICDLWSVGMDVGKIKDDSSRIWQSIAKTPGPGKAGNRYE